MKASHFFRAVSGKKGVTVSKQECFGLERIGISPIIDSLIEIIAIIQLTIGPSKHFLSHIGTRCVSSYMAYAIWELVPTWLKVLTWSGTVPMFRTK